MFKYTYAVILSCYRLRYFKRLITWLKWVVYFATMSCYDMFDDLHKLKFISALAIPLAWFVLIILSGDNGATISVMFVHILHKR